MELKIAILIPAYNEESKIRNTLKGIKNFNKEDIIVVDDGSTDNTSKIVEEEGVILLKHPFNRGKGRAHRTGFKYIYKNGYDYLITMDADGQHDSEEIPLFIKSINENNKDLIIGTRAYSLKNMPLLRYFTNSMTSLVVSILCGKRITDSQSGYRAIKVSALRKIPLSSSRYQTESEIIVNMVRAGAKVGFIPIKTIYSKDDVSYIHPIKDTIRFIVFAIKSFWR